MKGIIKAPAKINLCLKVNGKRDDGYHDLTMIMQQVSLFDTIEFEIINDNDFNSNKQINIKCNYNYLPTDNKNLVYNVVDYIFKKYNINDKIYINLNKMIPISGGLGGGSSDAASMLLYLNKYYKLNLNISELSNIALEFGSDIPFFLHKKICLCKGRGDIIKELNSFNNYYILLATPNIRVSTKEIYNKFDNFALNDEKEIEESKKVNELLEAISNRDLIRMSDNLFNHLEIVTELMFDQVSILKNQIMRLGAIKSLMSGSGPTVFGIFNSYFKANNCKMVLKHKFKDSFIFVAKPI